MSLHMLPLPPSLLQSLFCRSAASTPGPSSSFSTRSSRRRCMQALQVMNANAANDRRAYASRRRLYASSLPLPLNAVPSTSRSASTSTSGNGLQDPPALSTPHDPNQPRLRSSHELYQISSKKRRLVLFNDKTAKKLVDAMHLEKRKDLVVLDLYAG